MELETLLKDLKAGKAFIRISPKGTEKERISQSGKQIRYYSVSTNGNCRKTKFLTSETFMSEVEKPLDGWKLEG